MTHAEFKSAVEDFCEDVAMEVVRKNHDYAGENPNPFAAFDETADSLGMTREEVWAVFFEKHLRALRTWISSGLLASEDIESRLLDIAAYAAILAASIKENQNAAAR